MSSIAPMTQDPVVRTLLEAIARGGASAPSGEAVADYDWDSPCSFGLTEAASLDEFATALAEAMSQGMSSLLQGQVVNVTSAGFREVYAAQLAQAGGQGGVYGVEVTDERDRTIGAIELGSSGVRYLMASLLGGALTGEAGAIELTAVETDLLLEVVDAVVKALAQAVSKRGGGALKSRWKLACPPQVPADEPSREYCRVAFKLDPSRPEAELVLTVQGGILLAACGGGKQVTAKPVEETRKWLRHYVEGGMVAAPVQLASTNVPVRDLVDLQEGDVLILATRINDPVFLMVEGRPLLQGLPVDCEGHYGLRVTGRVPAPKAGKDATDKKG